MAKQLSKSTLLFLVHCGLVNINSYKILRHCLIGFGTIMSDTIMSAYLDDQILEVCQMTIACVLITVPSTW